MEVGKHSPYPKTQQRHRQGHLIQGDTSAAAPDGVPSSLLLKCAAELTPALKLIYS